MQAHAEGKGCGRKRGPKGFKDAYLGKGPYSQDVGCGFEGKLETKVPTIPEHVEYITREVLKNAVRATVEHHRASMDLPPVVVGIFEGKFDVLIKVSDRGGGFDRRVAKRIWEYGFTTARDLEKEKALPGTSVMEGTVQEQQKMQVAGFGVGLPLSRLYARYFGGDVHLSQMYGHGTDVLVNLNRLGNHTELDVSESDEEEEPTKKRQPPRQ